MVIGDVYVQYACSNFDLKLCLNGACLCFQEGLGLDF